MRQGEGFVIAGLSVPRMFSQLLHLVGRHPKDLGYTDQSEPAFQGTKDARHKFRRLHGWPGPS